MGLFRKAAQFTRRLKRLWVAVDPHENHGLRICRFEKLEPRSLLTADIPNINVGVFYYEADGGQDIAGDRLEITFSGGPPGAQLTHLVIDTDKDGLGLSTGDAFFDTQAGGLGASFAFPFTLVSQTGIDTAQATVSDGGTKLIFDFTGFDVGEKFIFSIDVDEKGFSAGSSNAIVEGEEFEGSILFARFIAPNFFATETNTLEPPRFFDTFSFAGLNLNLPPDNYIPPATDAEAPVRTAGVSAILTPVPLPITISGTVFNDVNLNNQHDPGDNGIAGVNLALLDLVNGTYVATGNTAVTNSQGEYTFTGVLPGTYRVVETQPAPYFSVGAKAGTVNGATVGVVTSEDVLSTISLLGGQNSIRNDFAEALPAQLSGHVYHDADNDGLFDPGETGIGGATIRIERLASTLPAIGSSIIEVQSAANGFWSAEGLRPGEYVVREVQPAGYFDGLDTAGSVGGTATNPGDEISGVFLASGANAINYNFGELLPVTIRGQVHTDTNFDCLLGPGETPLANVTIFLLDAQGNRLTSTSTNANGEYEFTGLHPGVYGVEEIQPAGFFDGGDKLGSHGGNNTINDKFLGATIGSGQTGVGYNFCEHPPATLAGKVYVDDNNNGQVDSGEPGIGGVTLNLLNAAGIATGVATVTAADGTYSFTGLEPGQYGVSEQQPSGFYDGLDTAGNAGGAAQNPGDTITGASLAPAQIGQNYNFGELRPVSIGGMVHTDVDGDCLLDPGEVVLSGDTVFLLDAQGNRIAETTTNAAGQYQFTDLAPGTYGVEEIQPAGMYDGGDSLGSHGGTSPVNDKFAGVVLASGQNATDYNFCEHPPASLSGKVYIDDNNNGQINAGETGIGGVTLQLLNAAGIATGVTTVTAADGTYTFTGLAPGQYGVAELQPAGFHDGLDTAGNAGGAAQNPGDKITGASLAPAQVGQNYNFGELRPVSISGMVHTDVDGDCLLDPGEVPLSGVTIFLLNAQGQRIAQTTTNANGQYQFVNLAPGTYGVEEIQPPGMFDGGDSLGSHGGTSPSNDKFAGVLLASGQNATDYNFCEHPPATLSGKVYIDDNNNGQINTGEAGIGGVTLQLLNAAGIATGVTTVTAADGTYSFTGLAPGQYGVAELQPSGFFDGLDTAGNAGGAAQNPGDRITGASLAPNQVGANYNFGELRPVSIGGRVHADLDGDCVFDPGEPLLAGVTMHLLDAAGNRIAATLTDANGQYRFTNLRPGTYGVEEIQPEGYYDEDEMVGDAGGFIAANDVIQGAVLASGVNALGYHFCEVLPASISGVVHTDTDGDCVLDPFEIPLAGVTIQLLDGGGDVIATTLTDANGYYEFTNLEPGEYGVHELQPPDYYNGDHMVGSAGGAISAIDTVTQVLLGSGVAAADYNFCEFPPASISGHVHIDLDGDCLFDPDEVPLEGISIFLLNGSGQRIAETLTDANGFYQFENLASGVYGVEEQQPPGLYHGDETVGSEGGVEAGQDRITGVLLGPGVDAIGYDFCELPPVSISGVVHADRNGDCLPDPEEPTIAGVTIYLLDAAGQRIANTTTDEDGRYTFFDLAPGTYGVEELQPAGYFDGDEMAGSEGGDVLSNDKITGVELNPGVDAFDYNFCEHEPVCITGTVYLDANNNTELDPDELGIAGVTLRLLDGSRNATNITTTTDADGFYKFLDLAPGTYGIVEVQPAGYFDGYDTPGTAGGEAENPGDRITGIVLAPGQIGEEYLFGEVHAAEITGYVFRDGSKLEITEESLEHLDVYQLRDGVRTPDDAPIGGVVLRLGDVEGNPILDSSGRPVTAVTDRTGFYRFSGLQPGTYSVFEAQPGGFVDSIDTPGTAGGLAANPGSEATPQFLTLGQDHNFDAIIQVTVAAGEISQENNFSEVQLVPPTPPIIFIPVPEPEPVPVPQLIPGPGFIGRAPAVFPPPPPAQIIAQPVYYGGTSYTPDEYSWHLSVIDAGDPRGELRGEAALVRVAESRVDVFGQIKAEMDESRWRLHLEDGTVRDVIFGMRDGIPVVGDFNGDGVSELGVFRKGQWYIDINGNGIWDEDDLWAELGSEFDRPVTGDWDGDGKTDIGVFGPSWPNDHRAAAAEPGLPDPQNPPSGAYKNVPPKADVAAVGWRKLRKTAHGKVRSDLVDHVFYFGSQRDVPLAGDWNGDGVSTIGIFHDGVWILDDNGDGQWLVGESMFEFGQAGDLPAVGDFDGDGVDQVAVFRDGVWYIDSNNNHRLDEEDQVLQHGQPGDRPITGDWDGDGRDEVGVYQPGGAEHPTP